MIAYLIWHLAGSSALAIVLNFLIELVILAIVFYLVVWVLGVIGIPVPQKVIQLLGVLVLLILILSLFAGCADLTPAQKTTLEQDAWNTVYTAGMGAANGALTGGGGQAIAGAVFAAASPGAIPKLVGDISAANGANAAQAASLKAATASATRTLNSSGVSPSQAVNIIGSAIQTAASQSFSGKP